MTSIGVISPPDQPPELLRGVAVATEEAGLDELWLWEDCFAESGVAAAAAALGWTQRIAVGIGLMPVPLRNVALTAMEIATLSRLFPGRILPGIGHGVLEWMGQVGVRAESPLTLLREYTTALRSLLDGETVTTDGRYVRLDDVRLTWPPAARPPLLVGAVRPKTLALAGELGDGVIFTGDTSPDQVADGVRVVREARERAGRAGAPDVVAFTAAPVGSRAETLAALVREHADAGATRVTVCGLDDEGRPVSDERILDLVGALGEVRAAG
ncbi:LLM class flavin-dependent oxidoreductase [Luteipulveratus flavus]|uniref:LLM class flavin-dependent oxidoreductase n=1 Tax=Luteipulveratus flavus TaxID=3031728 RepID=A0ABT6C913_9MICO|nr:LLM class flavin-dependent oxidoreductase [Luteipulveratus sp. YIM 133296]MDF8265413.1 LLM class flavin-dependent oxidoreductase [Luteipulveratus sp. YIM 133296]